MKPKLHFTALRNWINDPNGLIYYKGEYHLFYQHFPYAPCWGTMHWGHTVTKDFIHFQHLPIALYPSKKYDRNGCYSGSAIEMNGKMYLYYTAIQYLSEQDDYIHVQQSGNDIIACQALVISEDGYHFDNRKNKYLIIDTIKDETLGNYRHTRDPKVWRTKDNKISLIIGSKMKKDNQYYGEALFYESDDGVHFTYKNRFIDETLGDMWECPDIFEIDDQWYIVCSPEHIRKSQPENNAIYFPILFNEKTYTVQKEGNYEYLDYGLDFYAPQTFLDENQQRIMIGWLRMREPIKKEEWVGMLSMPRVLINRNNHLYQKVIPQIQQLFHRETNLIKMDQPFLLNVTLTKESYINLGGFEIYIQDDCLYTNREKVLNKIEKTSYIQHTPQLNNQYELEIYYDYHVFEIFINDGYYVISQIVDDLNDAYTLNAIKKLKIKVID